MSKTPNHSMRAIVARVVELERVCAIDPADSMPDTRMTIQTLASWIQTVSTHDHEVSKEVATLALEVRELRIIRGDIAELRKQFNDYVTSADPTKRSP